MLRDPAAARYAQAAFGLARDRGELDVWERDLRSLSEALAVPGAQAFTSSRQAPPAAKEEFLRRVLGQPAPLVWNLMRLLLSKGRLELLPQIAERFQELLDDERGIAHAQVVTAVPLSDEEQQALTRRLSDLTGRHVQVQAFVEPDILGGLVARIGDRLIDGSARTRLLALKRQLAGATR